MMLLIQSAMIFFGALMAAAVVALGEPAKSDVGLAASASSVETRAAGTLAGDVRGKRGWNEFAAQKQGFRVR